MHITIINGVTQPQIFGMSMIKMTKIRIERFEQFRFEF